MKKWDKTKEGKKGTIIKHKTRFVSPQIGAYFHQKNHTGILLNTDFGVRISKNNRKLYEARSLGVGYVRQFNAGTTYIQNEDQSISEKQGAARGYLMQAYNFEFGQQLSPLFDTNGIAYINKPYTQAAFNKAMLKYKEFFAQNQQLQLNLDALSIIEKSLQRNIKGYKKRFSIKKRDGIIVKPINEIVYFQACGEFCLLVDAEGDKHTINYKISKLETLVDTNDFFRINRS